MSNTPHQQRVATVRRATRETTIELTLHLDDADAGGAVETGLPFFDHMLTALAKHGRLGLDLRCEGDLHVDDHHTIEDCALTLGSAFDEALGDRRGVERFASAYAPLDESLARVVVDLSGRAHADVHLGFSRESIGSGSGLVATENLTHFFRSFAVAGRLTLHVDLVRGENDHHKIESAFKALAIALRTACARTGSDSVPSTKGSL